MDQTQINTIFGAVVLLLSALTAYIQLRTNALKSHVETNTRKLNGPVTDHETRIAALEAGIAAQSSTSNPPPPRSSVGHWEWKRDAPPTTLKG